MSDVGDQNVTQTKRLYRTLAAWDDLINLVNFTLEERERSHVVCCFQLPQVVRFASKWHRLPASRDNPSIYAELMCCPASLIFTEDGSPSVQFAREGDDGYVFSQMIALFPLWGQFKDDYPAYTDCISSTGNLVQRTFVSKEHGIQLSERFEGNLVETITKHLLTAVAFFLPAFSIASLLELPTPPLIPGLFVLTKRRRVVFKRGPEPILKVVLSSIAQPFPRPVSADRFKSVLAFGLRELSSFERQLLAMNRLRLQGEHVLALIGTVGLLEWYLNAGLDIDRRYQQSIRVLIKERTFELPSARQTYLNWKRRRLIACREAEVTSIFRRTEPVPTQDHDRLLPRAEPPKSGTQLCMARHHDASA